MMNSSDNCIWLLLIFRLVLTANMQGFVNVQGFVSTAVGHNQRSFTTALMSVGKPALSATPILALVTEPDANHHVSRTLEVIRKVLAHNVIQLICIRLNPEKQQQITVNELCLGVRNLVNQNNQDICKLKCYVVLNLNAIENDLQMAIKCKLDGVHVKERHREWIHRIRSDWKSDNIIIGTSCHNIDSAKEAASHDPDYLFVGTCFQTESHPDKSVEDLEGPELPGKVQRALVSIPCLAIGGINDSNCDIPVRLGAQGETLNLMQFYIDCCV